MKQLYDLAIRVIRVEYKEIIQQVESQFLPVQTFFNKTSLYRKQNNYDNILTINKMQTKLRLALAGSETKYERVLICLSRF